jgi:hypothetical protein
VLAGPAGAGGAAAMAALPERVAHLGDVVTQAVLQRAPVAAALADAEEPWLAAVARRLAAGAAPFAVLVVEAHDADRLLAAGGRDAASLDLVERAVRGAVRPADGVVRERAGRLWVIADGLDGDGARALADHVGEAVAGGEARHGARPSVAAGVAAFPADGAVATQLVACADERLFGARAAGLRVLPGP